MREPTSTAPLLSVRGVSVAFPSRKGPLTAVRNVSFHLERGQRVAVVGESGSGKSVTASALLRLVPSPGVMTSGSVEFEGRDLATLSPAQMRAVRGGGIALIAQDPFSSLNPLKTVGWQVKEALTLHTETPKDQLASKVVDLLRSVGLRDPERLAGQYPHELSGGMNQRVSIAMALAGDPALLLADEPTTALDATTQAGILELLIGLCEERDKSTLLITHDMGVVARFATHVLVMYAGEIVESGTVGEIFRESCHPYTRGLLESIPRVDRPSRTDALPGTAPSLGQIPAGCSFRPRCYRGRDEAVCVDEDPELLPVVPGADHCAACHFADEILARGGAGAVAPAQPDVARAAVANGRHETPDTLLDVRGLTKEFPLAKRMFGPRSKVTKLTAVDDVDLTLDPGETLAVVGESGCGKSTLARMVLGLTDPTEGMIHLRGEDITALKGKQARAARHGIQAVFQDPGGSLDPQMRVGLSVAEPLTVRNIGTAAERSARAGEMLERVGLSRSAAAKFPHQFSGGQRQRIALARALVVDPKLIVCDEPLTSLDVSVQSQILALLREVQIANDIAYLFISHDLAVIRQIAQRVVVMYLGNIVETGDVVSLFSAPAHPYSTALLDARPAPDPEEERAREHIVLKGAVPSAYDPPSGCPFHTRCWKTQALGDPEVCRTTPPQLATVGPDRRAACHFPEVEEWTGPVVAARRAQA